MAQQAARAQERKVVHGVDLEKLDAFRNSLKENPVRLGLQAQAHWEGVCGRSLVYIGPYELGGQKIDRLTRQYTVSYGAWKEVEAAVGIEGPTDRMEPVEMALGAIASCLAVAISFNAAREGIKIDDLEVTVKAEVDPSVLFAIKEPEEHTSCVPQLQYEIKVQGDLSDRDLARIKRLAEHSPVHGLVANANTIVSAVTLG